METANPTVAIPQKEGKALGFTGLHAQTIIAFAALIAVLFSIIQYSINPVKKDISRLEAGQIRLEERLSKVEERLSKLEAGQIRLEERLSKLEAGQLELKTIILSIQEKLNNK